MRTATWTAIFTVLTMTTALQAQTPPAADRPAISTDAMADLGQGMSHEEYEAMVQKANLNRLKSERKLAAAEIVGSMLATPDLCEQAAAELDKDARNTQADNIQQICQAFAKVDERFGEVWKLYSAGKYAQAAEKAKPLAAGNTQSTFQQAAKALVYAQALEGAKADYNDTAQAYGDLAENMPDRISFASEAARRLADVYHKNGRGIYAMESYTYLLRNYGLSLGKTTFDEVVAKVAKLKEVYGDPMGSVAKMMGTVKERLDRIDSGKQTQLTEQEIIALLNDLILTEQDKGTPPQPNSSGSQKDPSKEPGKEPSSGKNPATSKSPLPGRNGRKVSVLPGGDKTSKGPEGRFVDSFRNAEFEKGLMSPMEKDRLLELCRFQIGERYRRVVIDYHRAIAEARRNK